MRFLSVFAPRSLAACALLAFTISAGAAPTPPAPQDKDKKEVKTSEGEAKLGEKINKAPDAAAKLQLSEEFVKKYPQSAHRQQIADYVAAEVSAVADPAQKIALAEKYVAVFTGPGESGRMNAALVNLYIDAKRLDDAYRAGGVWLEKNPDEVSGRTRLALVGVAEAQKKNPKFVGQSVEYAKQAIALMEADKKPAGSDDAQRQQFKAQWLPQLHQALGLVAHASGNAAEAKTRLDKAVALGIADPITYVLMADMADREYEEMALKYKAMTPGAEQDAQLKRALEKLDQVIDLYAHAVALTGDNPDQQPLREQLMQPLTSYYKYRHNNSTDGLQQLIDKHKKPVAAPATPAPAATPAAPPR